jgi:hypothetical protein
VPWLDDIFIINLLQYIICKGCENYKASDRSMDTLFPIDDSISSNINAKQYVPAEREKA